MKIADSDILMNSSRMYLESDETKESLRVWINQQPNAGSIGKDTVTISPMAESLSKEYESELEESELESMEGETFLKKLIIEMLSGRRFEPVRIERGSESDFETDGRQTQASRADQRQGWGVQYDYEETHLEKEDVSFEAKGIIRTADGKEFGFALRLDMNREYLEKNSINIRAGDAAIDPLVINFDGNAADLTNVKFGFDLNADGANEELSIPSPGRGFLAVDLNGDGTIGDGSELFGPSTGNGFVELSTYDGDGNGWIDESDEVYKKLQVMTISGDGNNVLHTLKDLDIGAIYLGRESTQFDIRTRAENNLLGRVRSTGVYLHEDGTPGTIQQLDLVA